MEIEIFDEAKKENINPIWYSMSISDIIAILVELRLYGEQGV